MRQINYYGPWSRMLIAFILLYRFFITTDEIYGLKKSICYVRGA